MTQIDYFITIEEGATATFRERGSQFIGITLPITDINDFKAKLAAIKKEHPKATHHCFAYRLGLDGNQFRASDDGEPSGSAGKPILGQIDSKQLTNILVVVVRYFGGSLLGVPGLINAYKSTASMALQVTKFVQKPILVNYHLKFDYTLVNEVIKIIKQFDCQIIRQEMQLFCEADIGVPRNRKDEVVFKWKQLRGVEIVRRES